MLRVTVAVVVTLGISVGVVAPALAQSPLDRSVNAATEVLREIKTHPLKCIPEVMLRDAQGIVVIPGMVKSGLIIGMEHGQGVLVTRDDTGHWRAPVFVTLTGKSIGAQIGIQSTDLVLVLKTRRSVDTILKGKATIGTDFSVAAGPLGREAVAATDKQLKAEILSYSRSRGVFAGLALDGVHLHIDQRANADYYGARPGQPQIIPASALELTKMVSAYAPPPPQVVVQQLPPPVIAAPDEREVCRQQLVAAVLRLQPVLDPAWQKYLALPPEVFTGHAVTTFDPYLQRFQVVASDARYRALSDHHEFQEVHTLLRRYASLSQTRPAGTLTLPPPPGH